MRTLLPALWFVGLAVSVTVADETTMATVAPPRSAQAKFEADQLHLVVTRWALVPEVVTINERVNGQIVSRQQVMHFWSPTQHARALRPNEFRVLTADGKALDADTVARRFKQQTEVLVDETGQALGDVYSRLLKPEAVIVVPLVPPPRPKPEAALRESSPALATVEDPQGPPPRLALVRGEANALAVVEAAWEEVVELAVTESVVRLPNGERHTCASSKPVVRHVPSLRTAKVPEDDVRSVRRDGSLEVAKLPPQSSLAPLHEAGTTFDPVHLKWYRDDVPILQVKLAPPMVERLVPDRPPPRFVVSETREDKLAIGRLDAKSVLESIKGTQEVERDGKTVTENVERQERVASLEVSRVELPLAEVKGTTLAGVEIDSGAMAKRLTSPTVVLESLDAAPAGAAAVGTAYRALFKDESLVIRLVDQRPPAAKPPAIKPAADNVPKPSPADRRRGIPPKISFARAGGEFLVLRDLIVTPVVERRARVVNVNGQMQTEIYEQQNWTTNFEDQALRGENYRVVDATGKKLTADQVQSRLKGEVAVLVARDAKPIDDAYLAHCKPDALVVYPRFPGLAFER